MFFPDISAYLPNKKLKIVSFSDEKNINSELRTSLRRDLSLCYVYIDGLFADYSGDIDLPDDFPGAKLFEQRIVDGKVTGLVAPFAEWVAATNSKGNVSVTWVTREALSSGVNGYVDVDELRRVQKAKTVSAIQEDSSDEEKGSVESSGLGAGDGLPDSEQVATGYVAVGDEGIGEPGRGVDDANGARPDGVEDAASGFTGKRGRGRPRKVTREEVSQSGATDSPPLVTEKRGRGRPRKDNVEDVPPVYSELDTDNAGDTIADNNDGLSITGSVIPNDGQEHSGFTETGTVANAQSSVSLADMLQADYHVEIDDIINHKDFYYFLSESPDDFSTDDTTVVSGAKARARNNLAALRLAYAFDVVRKDNMERNYRIFASSSAQEILSKFTGWGGLTNVFRDPSGAFQPGWEKIGVEVESILSKQDLDKAVTSTLDAFYTSPQIVDSIWKGLLALGYHGGRIMEPSCGTGIFFARQPHDSAANSQRFAVEMDTTTASIAKLLYPNVDLANSSYQDSEEMQNEMDILVGNPPFGDQRVYDNSHPEWSKIAPNIHSYFFEKGIHQLRDGGVMAMVVSRYFLDARAEKYEQFREMFARQANLITAVRLPRTAFMKNSGTQVVTDILFFQKRNQYFAGEWDDENPLPSWVKADVRIGTDEAGEPINANGWYADHPELIFGKAANVHGMYKDKEFVVLPVDGWEENLDKYMSGLDQVEWPDRLGWLPRNRKILDQMDGVPAGSFFLVAEGDQPALYQKDFQTGKGVRADTIEVLVPIRKTKKQTDDEEDSENTEDAVDFGDVDEESSEDSRAGMVEKKKKFTDTDIARIIHMVTIKNALTDLLRLQVTLEVDEGSNDQAVDRARLQLNNRYDSFVRSYGLLNRRKNKSLIKEDPMSPALWSLESNYVKEISAAVARRTGEQAKPESAEKAAIFSIRTQYPPYYRTNVESSLDAISLSLSRFGRISPKDILEWVAASKEKSAVDGLRPENEVELSGSVFPSENTWASFLENTRGMLLWDIDKDMWSIRDLVLGGDILGKIEKTKQLISMMRSGDTDIPEGAADAINMVGVEFFESMLVGMVTELNKVIPEKISIADIDVSIGTSWVPQPVMDAFIKENFTGAQAVYQRITGTWAVDGKCDEKATLAWGTSGVSPEKMLSLTLNRKTPIVFDLVFVNNKQEHVVNEEKTVIAKQLQRSLKQTWDDWIKNDPDRCLLLEKTYNDTFNRMVPVVYDGSHLELDGASKAISLRPHQKNVIWRGLNSQSLLIDHAVGSGKTYAAISLVMESKRMGITNKAMVVVPNHITEDWRNSFLTLYPSAKVLMATREDMAGNNRQTFLGRAAYGDYDAVIIPHSSFSLIPSDPSVEKFLLDREVSAMEDYLRSIPENQKGTRAIKQIARKMERFKAKIEERVNNIKNDTGIHFGMLGVDFLVVDESHEFKNLPFDTGMQNVSGLGNPSGSNKAQDLYIKVNDVKRRNGKTVFLTGTPISNTLAELYLLQKYLSYDRLVAMGVEHFDSWASTFSKAVTEYAFTLTGEYKEKTYLSTFVNFPELCKSLDFIDSVTIDDVQKMMQESGQDYVNIPGVRNGAPEILITEPTDAQKRIIGYEVDESPDGTPLFNEGSILWQLDNMPKRPKKGDPNILSCISAMSKVGLDPRAYRSNSVSTDPAFKGDKIDTLVDVITKEYHQWESYKGTQLVFLDFSTPNVSKKTNITNKKILDCIKAVDEMDAAGESASDALKIKAEKAEEFLEKLSAIEIEDARNSVEEGNRWSAYEQIRDQLIEKGIPEHEIAFIHDFETIEKKKEIFGKVRAGVVRVLMGSSSKMGAGMNVQNKIVALHHVDAPWRPLDIEQRNGRGLRQGNEIMEDMLKKGLEYPGVLVTYSVTKDTSDAGRYQILELKQKFNSAFRNRNNSMERTISDPDMASFDPAKIKAQASGSDVLMDVTVLQQEVKKLNAERSGLQSKRILLKETISKLTKKNDLYSSKKDLLVSDLASVKKYFDDTRMNLIALQGEELECRTKIGAIMEQEKEERKRIREAERDKRRAEKQAEKDRRKKEKEYLKKVAKGEAPMENGEDDLAEEDIGSDGQEYELEYTQGDEKSFVPTQNIGMGGTGLLEKEYERLKKIQEKGPHMITLVDGTELSDLSFPKLGSIILDAAFELNDSYPRKDRVQVFSIGGFDVSVVMVTPPSGLMCGWYDVQIQTKNDYTLDVKCSIQVSLPKDNSTRTIGRVFMETFHSMIENLEDIIAFTSDAKERIETVQYELDKAENHHNDNVTRLAEHYYDVMSSALRSGLRRSSLLEERLASLNDLIKDAQGVTKESLSSKLELLYSIADDVVLWRENRDRLLECIQHPSPEVEKWMGEYIRENLHIKEVADGLGVTSDDNEDSQPNRCVNAF